MRMNRSIRRNSNGTTVRKKPAFDSLSTTEELGNANHDLLLQKEHPVSIDLSFSTHRRRSGRQVPQLPRQRLSILQNTLLVVGLAWWGWWWCTMSGTHDSSIDDNGRLSAVGMFLRTSTFMTADDP